MSDRRTREWATAGRLREGTGVSHGEHRPRAPATTNRSPPLPFSASAIWARTHKDQPPGQGA